MQEREIERAVMRAMETILQLELKAVRQALGKDDADLYAPRRRGARKMSLVDQSVEILTDEACPLHVGKLVVMLRDRFGRVTDRDTLSSALAKKARQGRLLCQTAPATFGLLEEAGE